MIIAGHLLLEDGPDRCRIAPGSVRVEKGAITEVTEGAFPARFNLGGEGCLITPGFIDTHLHLPQFDMIGAHGLPLLEWLGGVTFPCEARWADADYAEAMTRRVAHQLLAHGTTAVCAYSSVHHAATAVAIETLAAEGLRGVVGQAMSDRFAPEGLTLSADDLLSQTADLLDRYPAAGRVAAAVTPRFAVSCTPELLAGAGRLAAEHPRALVQSHLSETVPECRLISELYGGKSYVEVYREAGLVTERSLFGHGIYLSDAERSTLAQAGAVVAHCPTANSFLRSGAMDRHAALTAGNRLSLGSDIGGGYERSMVRVARAMIGTASALGEDYPSAAAAWRQITAGNADAAGIADAGRLAVGAPADLVVVTPDVPWLAGPVDPLAFLMFAWDDRWITQTLCRGRVATGEGVGD